MTIVADASALLCFIFEETGHEPIGDLLVDAAISTVNWCEVLTKMVDRGADPDRALELMQNTGLKIMPFDRAQAEAAGRLRAVTRRAGLSLGDRACLALTLALGGRAITCDRGWAAIADDAQVIIDVLR